MVSVLASSGVMVSLLASSGVMVSVLASSGVDLGGYRLMDKTIYYKIGICCFFAKNVPLRIKSKYWLAWNQDNVSG